MIAHIAGVVAEKFGTSLIVDVHGVGYEVAVATADYESATLGEDVKLYTFHHIREQSQELFGFSSLAAKKLFELLITVQGVGPKAGLAILSLADAETVRNAIANADSAYLAKAKGIGKKTAESVVVKLSDKVGMPIVYRQSSTSETDAIPPNDEALEALMALGYSLADASRALDGIDRDLPTAARVTQALKDPKAK